MPRSLAVVWLVCLAGCTAAPSAPAPSAVAASARGAGRGACSRTRVAQPRGPRSLRGRGRRGSTRRRRHGGRDAPGADHLRQGLRPGQRGGADARGCRHALCDWLGDQAVHLCRGVAAPAGGQAVVRRSGGEVRAGTDPRRRHHRARHRRHGVGLPRLLPARLRRPADGGGQAQPPRSSPSLPRARSTSNRARATPTATPATCCSAGSRNSPAASRSRRPCSAAC